MGESGSMRHRIRTVHHINGRLRLQVPAARANPAVLEEIRKSIAGLPGVTGVHANSRTGSVLVQYSPKAKTDFQAVLADHGERTGGFLLDPPEVSEVDEMARRIEAEAEFLSQHSETARIIVDAVKRMDVNIKRATHNTVDLKVLLPLGLAAYSIVEIGLEASTPLWVTLGIFSFNSFVSLHSPPGAVDRKEEIVVTDTATTETMETSKPARKKERGRQP